MNKIGIAILLLVSTFAWARSIPNPDDYTIHVLVTRSRVAEHGIQKLNVLIDGKKYELEGSGRGALLSLGDYQAKRVHDDHKNTYESSQAYEFLFPDKKVRRFWVTGQTE